MDLEDNILAGGIDTSESYTELNTSPISDYSPVLPDSHFSKTKKYSALQSSTNGFLSERDAEPSISGASPSYWSSNYDHHDETLSHLDDQSDEYCAQESGLALSVLEPQQQLVVLSSFKEFPFPAQPSRQEIAQEQTLQALDNSLLQSNHPVYALITPPADIALQQPITPQIMNASNSSVDISQLNEPEDFETSHEDRHLHELPPAQIPLKSSASEIKSTITAHIATTVLNHESQDDGHGLPKSLATVMNPTPDVFESRELPPHLQFTEANLLYRPSVIRTPPIENNEDGFFVYPSPPAEAMKIKSPNINTYADATNLAMQYPEHASTILEKSLNSISSILPPDVQLEEVNAMQPVSEPHSVNFGPVDVSIEARHPIEQDSVDSTSNNPAHTFEAPNWASAPATATKRRSHHTNVESRQRGHGRHRRSNSNQNGKATSQQQSFECQDNRRHHRKQSSAATVHQPYSIQAKDSQLHSRGQENHTLVYDRVLDTKDQFVKSPSHQHHHHAVESTQIDSGGSEKSGRLPLQNDIFNRISSGVPRNLVVPKTREEEMAVKVLTLAGVVGVEVDTLIRMAAALAVPEDNLKTEGSWSHDPSSASSPSLPPLEIPPLKAEIAGDLFWNAPRDRITENANGHHDILTVKMPTHLSSVFAPTTKSTHGRGKISGGQDHELRNSPWNDANVAENDTLSLWSKREISECPSHANNHSNTVISHRARGRRPGDWQEPNAGQPFHHSLNSGLKYYGGSDAPVAFEVIDRVDDGCKKVFLRYGSHVAQVPSKFALSGNLANSNIHLEQMGNGYDPDGKNLTGVGGYGSAFAAVGAWESPADPVTRGLR